ncbi:MAG: cob(I)yrinic acid a,c-diamide adenosyltransferase [Methanomassiliicoccales archaeon]|nr:MAG: cob(I)yrinic acid a,c-diamide adenosyltransferase [Methanomassiliicoccales archaeon]
MSENGLEAGLVQVYTGDGKGKTTAALGLALRACGHGLKVYMIQFMKGDINYGEIIAAEHLPNLTIVQFGKPTFVDKENPAKEDIDFAQLALEHAKVIVQEGQYDIVILDELNVALDFKLVELADVMKIIDSKPDRVELIITGRNANEKILEKADLVTKMDKVKHPYDKGIAARDGIEH